MSRTRRVSQTIYLQVFAFVLLACLSGPSFAQTPAASPCDPAYFESMKSRAWLEAQREITQNQNLIAKPDSVLEYTCFNQHLNVLATNAKDMFSENPRWGGAAVDMGLALQNPVGATVVSYVNANFGHSFRGGRSGLDGSVGPISTASYNCSAMNQVWQEAKCSDFIEDGDNDGFYTFAEYAGSPDKRRLPVNCAAPAVAGKTWSDNISKAYENTPWTEDQVTTFLDRLTHITPDDCEASDPIPTGLTVSSPQAPVNGLPEKICVMPGCYYKAIPNQEGKCVALDLPLP